MSWLWWAPMGAATLHIVEEFVYPGGFASWDRDYRPSIRGSITLRLHLVVNALLLAACAIVGISGMPDTAIAVGGLRFRSPVPASLSVPGWLTLAALLNSNAIFHIVGTYRMRRVSPGVRTGVLLYVPLAVFGYWHFIHAGEVSPVAAGISALLGSSYHFWAALAHRWRSRRREAGAVARSVEGRSTDDGPRRSFRRTPGIIPPRRVRAWTPRRSGRDRARHP